MLSSLFSSKQFCIGIDIQPRRIYLLELKRGRKKWDVANQADVDLPSEVIKGGKIMDAERVVKALTELRDQTQTHGALVAIALPGNCVLRREISISSLLKKEEYEADITLYLEKYLQSGSEKICFDYLLQKKEEKAQHVLILAAKEEMISEYNTVIKNAGYRGGVIDIDWYAMVRAINVISPVEGKIIIIMEVDNELIKIICIQNTKIIFTDQKNSYNDLLATSMECLHAVIQILSDQKIDCIYMWGFNTHLREVISELKSFFNIPIITPKFTNFLNYQHTINETKCSLVSIGLAMRKI